MDAEKCSNVVVNYNHSHTEFEFGSVNFIQYAASVFEM